MHYFSFTALAVLTVTIRAITVGVILSITTHLIHTFSNDGTCANRLSFHTNIVHANSGNTSDIHVAKSTGTLLIEQKCPSFETAVKGALSIYITVLDS